MNHQIEWNPKAVKQLLKIPRHNAVKIKNAVCLLENDETMWRNVKKLINHKYGYRLRVGSYRVLFDLKKELIVLVVEEIKKRDEQTY